MVGPGVTIGHAAAGHSITAHPCLLERMGTPPPEALMAGDEEKDILCAKGAGGFAVLMNRTGTPKLYGQDAEIRSLSELLSLIR